MIQNEMFDFQQPMAFCVTTILPVNLQELSKTVFNFLANLGPKFQVGAFDTPPPLLIESSEINYFNKTRVNDSRSQ